MRKLTDNEIRAYRTWYSDARDLIYREYEDPELFIGLLAATSPRTQVRRNWTVANRIYRTYRKGGPINYTGCMKTHLPNIGRALRGEELSGLKVESFRQNLLGSDNHVTIDVWMIRWFGFDKTDGRITPEQYRMLAARCRRNAKSYNLTPAEYQAVAWVAVMSDNGRRPISFVSVWRSLNQQMTLWDLED